MQITPGSALFDTTSGSAGKKTEAAAPQAGAGLSANAPQQPDRAQPVQASSESATSHNDAPPERVDITV